MSEVSKPATQMTRRNFLKTSAVVAGSAWLGSNLGIAPEGAMAEEVQEGEQVFVNCCRPNCFNACMLNVHVREGKVVKTSPADFPNKEFNRVCLRGLAHVTNMYSPARLQYPLKRVEGTERGAGQWERVTWDEALTDIAEKFKVYQEEFGPQSIIRSVVSGNYGAINGGWTTKLFNAMNASSMGSNLDMGNFYGIMRVVGMAGLWPGNDPRDYKNADTIFLWGNNLTDAQIQDWHFFADALEAGAKMIVVDPIYTQSAAKADKFVAVRPGSDTALIMSMMYVVITEDRVDTEFMLSKTVAPFLVNSETGKFVRANELTGEELAEGEVGDYVVYDEATGELCALTAATAPAMEYDCEINGVACNTAYTLLKNEVMQFAPEVATELCDVPAETIVELARICCEGNVMHRVGWGPQAYDNGIHPHHAGLALAALTGKMCSSGNLYSSANWTYFSGANPEVSAVPNPVTSPTIPNVVMADAIAAGEWLGQPFQAKALWVHNGNPLCTFVDTNSMLNDVFAKLDLIVTVDLNMTDTARYSDYVLPCAQFFEYEDIITQGNHYHLVHATKAVEPPAEALPDTQIIKMLAEKMGYGDLFTMTENEWLRAYLDTEANAAMGLTYETLAEQHAFRYLPDPFLLWTDGIFYTPSQRMEFYVENPTVYGVALKPADLDREHLPHFFEPREAWPGTELAERFPFVLMSERPRYRVHGQWAYDPILRELDPEPTVKMNPADAEALGIEDGTHVECYNDRGHAVAKLVCNDAIRPGTLVYPKSWQLDQHIAGGWSEPLSREVDPVAVNQSYMDCRVAVRVWEGAEA